MNIELSKQVVKALDKLDGKMRERIVVGIEGLAKEHQIGQIKPLVGVKNVFRLRIANYRLLFEFTNDCIHIIKLSPRGDAYKNL